MRETISIKLFNTLLKGKEKLGKEALGRMLCFVESQKAKEHSFINKGGKADLYYTVFGWMLSFVLGIKLDHKKTASYLSMQPIDNLDLIHYAAYMRCQMIRLLMKRGKAGLLLKSPFIEKIKDLEEFEGLPHNDPQSPYTQFIWLSLLEDSGNKIKDKKDVLGTLTRYRLAGGGYMNTKDGLTAATNATVAALSVIGQLEGYEENSDIYYLRNLQDPSGGFYAAKASPVPDLLSTATTLFMLSCYGLKPRYPARDFLEAHWLGSGGFSATVFDDKSDVEYTFYGLLALGTI